jgi:hypothetical protein
MERANSTCGTRFAVSKIELRCVKKSGGINDAVIKVKRRAATEQKVSVEAAFRAACAA